MTPVMISCVQRRDTERPITLASLANVGVHPIVVESECNPAGARLNRHAAWHALSRANGAALFLEDDVLVKPTLTRALEMAVAADVITVFCLLRERLLTREAQAILARARAVGRMRLTLLPLDPLEVPKRRGFYGTQAVYLPERVVRCVLEDAWSEFVGEYGAPMDVAPSGFDFWLKERASEFGGMFTVVPNPVQHRNPPKMRAITGGRPTPAKRAHASATYGMEVIE